MTIRYQSLRGKRFLQDNTQHFPFCAEKKVSLICLVLAPNWRQEMPHFCGGRRCTSRQPSAPLAGRVPAADVCHRAVPHPVCAPGEQEPGFCCGATQESLELVASLIRSPVVRDPMWKNTAIRIVVHGQCESSSCGSRRKLVI